MMPSDIRDVFSREESWWDDVNGHWRPPGHKMEPVDWAKVPSTYCPVTNAWCKACHKFCNAMEVTMNAKTKVLRANLDFWLFYIDRGLEIGPGVLSQLRNDIVQCITLVEDKAVGDAIDEVERAIKAQEDAADREVLDGYYNRRRAREDAANREVRMWGKPEGATGTVQFCPGDCQDGPDPMLRGLVASPGSGGVGGGGGCVSSTIFTAGSKQTQVNIEEQEQRSDREALNGSNGKPTTLAEQRAAIPDAPGYKDGRWVGTVKPSPYVFSHPDKDPVDSGAWTGRETPWDPGTPRRHPIDERHNHTPARAAEEDPRAVWICPVTKVHCGVCIGEDNCKHRGTP